MLSISNNSYHLELNTKYHGQIVEYFFTLSLGKNSTGRPDVKEFCRHASRFSEKCLN